VCPFYSSKITYILFEIAFDKKKRQYINTRPMTT